MILGSSLRVPGVSGGGCTGVDDPQRMMPPAAFEVHGLSDAFLRGKPLFRAVAAEFIAFVGDAPQFDDITMLVLRRA